MASVDLKTFSNSNYHHGAGALKRILWHIVSKVFIHSQLLTPISFKLFLLRSFGAKIGKGVVIKPNVNIKHPWMLEVGDYTWLGEAVWIDNLVPVKIGNHCCLSQGALLLTGNHNYKKTSFDFIGGEIVMEDGSWAGAKTVICPSVTLASHSVLAVGSIATKDTTPYGIFQGNPAQFIKLRTIQ